jgi:hypothetical protein
LNEKVTSSVRPLKSRRTTNFQFGSFFTFSFDFSPGFLYNYPYTVGSDHIFGYSKQQVENHDCKCNFHSMLIVTMLLYVSPHLQINF